VSLPLWSFDLLAALLLFQRLHELRLSARHRRSLGPPDFGPARPERALLAFHGLFFLLPLTEAHLRAVPLPALPFWTALAVLLLAQGVRWQSQRQLGTYWTTLPACWRGQRLQTSGLYRHLKHPNYWAVAAEVLAFPAAGGAWWSWLLLNCVHPIVLGRRVQIENAALQQLKTASVRP
jgi:methyltransferase